MLENIEISDYKCFKNFKLDGLSQINIISGNNNVGKTALLEAIFLIKNSEDIRSFVETIKSMFLSRDLSIEDIDKYLENINLSLKYNDVNITIKHKFIDELANEKIENLENFKDISEEFLLMTINNTLTILPFLKLKNSSFMRKRTIENKFDFIDSSKPTNFTLTILYSFIQELGIQAKFLKYLQIIDKNIIGIEPQIKRKDKPSLRVTLDNPRQSLLSSELGEGTNRFIEILATLLKTSNGVVLIDEIENGIHYSKLKDIWTAIIKIVQKEEIQLFVTTHDKESIEALIEASEESKYEDISSIQLYKDDKNNITPIVLQYKDFAYGINRGADVR